MKPTAQAGNSRLRGNSARKRSRASARTSKAGGPRQKPQVPAETSSQRGAREAEPRKAQEQLRDLVAGLMANQDSSNRTLARELHHVVSQKLAFLALEVSALGQRPWRSAPALRRWIDHLGTEIGRTAVHVHELSGGLYPLAVEDLGLKAALRAECREFSGQYGVPCRFHWSGAPETIPLPVALCLYRVAQEALRNAGRHAGAEHVEIRVVRTRLAIEMMVSDTGAGFRVDGVKTGGGLLTMEERSRMIGGEFEVTSTEGRGTTLVVRAPLKAGVA